MKQNNIEIVSRNAPRRRKIARRGEFTLKKGDIAFSAQIRARDKKCMFPNCTRTTNLQCSHYIGRATKSTRFYEDNCITLCYFHHYGSKDLGFEYQKQTKEKHGYDGQYTLFMKKCLGLKRWNKLIKQSKLGGKVSFWLNEYKQKL